MGLIREPKNVDFTVIDQPWTTEEREVLSDYIKSRKSKPKKSVNKKNSSKDTISK